MIIQRKLYFTIQFLYFFLFRLPFDVPPTSLLPFFLVLPLFLSLLNPQSFSHTIIPWFSSSSSSHHDRGLDAGKLGQGFILPEFRIVTKSSLRTHWNSSPISIQIGTSNDFWMIVEWQFWKKNSIDKRLPMSQRCRWQTMTLFGLTMFGNCWMLLLR